MSKRKSNAKVSTSRLLWLASIGLIAVGYRHGKFFVRRAIAAGKVSAVFTREIAADVRAHLSGASDIAMEATHLRHH